MLFSIAGGGKAYYKVWHLLDEDAKAIAREDMKEAKRGRHAAGGRASRLCFDDNLMKAVDERNMAWVHATRVLGDSHAIFNKFNNKGKKTKVSAGRGSVKAIKALSDVLKLTGWRLEPQCTQLLYLTDKQKSDVITALDSLYSKLQVCHKAQNENRRPSTPDSE